MPQDPHTGQEPYKDLSKVTSEADELVKLAGIVYRSYTFSPMSENLFFKKQERFKNILLVSSRLRSSLFMSKEISEENVESAYRYLLQERPTIFQVIFDLAVILGSSFIGASVPLYITGSVKNSLLFGLTGLILVVLGKTLNWFTR